MTLMKLLFLVPSVLVFNNAYISPNPAPNDDETISGGPLYERICPAIFPILQRVCQFSMYRHINEYHITVVGLDTLCCRDSRHTRGLFSIARLIWNPLYSSSQRTASGYGTKHILHTRNNPRPLGLLGTPMVFSCHGTPFHSPAQLAQGPLPRHRRSVQHRAPS